jgi:enoyl-[acyl-carrier protein] reductase II
MFHTVLCDLLGVRYPIIQGAMQGAGGPRLVAAVSNAGGLGVLPTFGGTEAALRADIEATRALTKQPFAVNITPIGRAFTESRAATCIDMSIRIVTTGRGDPGTDIVERLKAAGVVVLPVVPSVKHALRVQAEGADAIIASGSEAGGHVGTVSTLALVPQVVDAVRVPVVAAGGIADARGFVAALALGACGIQLGTRFIATPESEAGTHIKQRILEARETDTVVTTLLTGKTVRTIATAALKEFEAARTSGASPERQSELRERFIADSRNRDGGERVAVAGQIAGMIRDIRPVGQIMEEIIRGAAALSAGICELAAGGASGDHDR